MRPLLSLAFLLVFPLAGQLVNGQEPAADAKSALAQLDRFTGTWEKQFTVYQSQWSPEEQTKSGTQTGVWILNGQHLQETGRDSDGLSYMTVYSYDAAAKEYRACVFQSNGSTWQMSGEWDAASSALTWTQQLGGGVRMIATYKFVAADRFNFSYVAKSQDNQELFRLEGKGTRHEPKTK